MGIYCEFFTCYVREMGTQNHKHISVSMTYVHIHTTTNTKCGKSVELHLKVLYILSPILLLASSFFMTSKKEKKITIYNI